MILSQRNKCIVKNPLATRDLNYEMVFKNIISNVQFYVHKRLSSLNDQNKLFFEINNLESHLKKANSNKSFNEISDVKFILGLSGGMDSAIINFIMSLIFGGKSIFAITMPSENNSSHTQNKARDLARLLKNNFEIHEISIEKDDGENDQALKRALILQKKRDVLVRNHGAESMFLILNTSNLSEIQTGNFTINGDTIGDFGILRGLFKSEIYQLFDWMNSDDGKNYISKNFTHMENLNSILKCLEENSNIIPSAELKDAGQQKDADVLLHHDDFYSAIDMILIGKSKDVSNNELCNALLHEDLFVKWILEFLNRKNISCDNYKEIVDFAIKKVESRIALANNKVKCMGPNCVLDVK